MDEQKQTEKALSLYQFLQDYCTIDAKIFVGKYPAFNAWQRLRITRGVECDIMLFIKLKYFSD